MMKLLFGTSSILERSQLAVCVLRLRSYQSIAHHHQKRDGNKETPKQIKWFGIPLGLGITCLAALQLVRTLRRERKSGVDEAVTWQLAMFRLLPARPLSRTWGLLSSYELPVWMRRPVLGLYAWAFGCDMKEAIVEDLGSYQSLLHLFTRQLKHGCRTISSEHELVSPSDGKILHFGHVDADGILEQVKGVTYRLEKFLGPGDSSAVAIDHNLTESETMPLPSGNVPKKTLYHVIIYLAPGDCHHFHSPADWNVALRRHFPGELLTVAPWAAKTMPGLFTVNERVILSGKWKHGFFVFAAVGAFNVGSIRMTVDKDLQTNVKGYYTMGEYTDRQLDFTVKKGARVGYFSLGSSIVLVFEAPENFKFLIKPGQTIKLGQPLGFLDDGTAGS